MTSLVHGFSFVTYVSTHVTCVSIVWLMTISMVLSLVRMVLV